MQSYNAIIIGAAERILTMAEDDAKHQRAIEMPLLMQQNPKCALVNG